MQKWLNMFFVASALATGAVEGQSLSIHRGDNGIVFLQVQAKAGKAFRLEKSLTWSEWLRESDPWIESKTFTLHSQMQDAGFYRLETWDAVFEPVTVGILGDSTVVDFSFWDGTFGGWGESIPAHFGPDARIANMAQPGESTRTFLETSWRVKNLQQVSPDFVLIQYGMIDEIASEPEKRTTMEAYEHNLETLVQVVRDFDGTPVLITPPAKRAYGPDGKVVSWLEKRSAIVLKVAEELHCPSVDLNRMTRDYFNEKGNAATQLLTTEDRLHYKIDGARVLAGMVVRQLPEILKTYLDSNADADLP